MHGCLSYFFSSTASAHKKDSLVSLLNSHPQQDTVRANLLAGIAELYKDANLDSLIHYTREAMSVSDKINFRSGKADGLRIMGLVHLRRNEYDSAISNYLGALNIYVEIGRKNKQGQVLRSVADIYYRQLKYETSIEYYNKSITVSEEINDLTGAGLSYLSIGGAYFDQANYADAITYYFKALKHFEKISDRNGESMTLINIATTYSAVGNNKLAKEYVDKGLVMSEGLTEKEVVFSNMVNIGVVFADMKDYRSALAAFLKGRALADSLGDRTWKNICLGNIADSYYELGMYDTAYVKYTELLRQPGGMTDTNLIVLGQSCMGLVLVRKGNIKEGIDHLRQAFTIARKKGMKKNIFDISGALSEAYEKLHDYQRAYEYHKIYFDYHDSLNSAKNDKKIQQLHFDYELGKKESQIELLKNNRIIEEDKSEKQQIVMWASLSGLLLFIIICILLYRTSLQERRNKEKILKQKEEIQQQAIRLEELNTFKDKTFSVLSHDLRSPLGALTAALKMLDEKSMTAEDFMYVKPEVQSQLTSLNILLDNLLNWAKGYMQGKTTESPETIDLNDLVTKNIDLVENAAAVKQVHILNNIPTSTTALGYPGQIDIAIRNLLMNAIKFSNNNGAITFSGTKIDRKVQISITDEGVGMSAAQISKLFTATNDNSTYGTGGEKGIGIGLLLCYEFIKANNGTISVTSELNKGTTFTITLQSRSN
jgi:signal transduction histidine kinase